MKHDFPYDYVTLFIFEYLWTYERKNSITKEELKEFHKRVIQGIIDSYQNNEEYLKMNDNSYYEKYYISCDVSFNAFDEDKELDRFLGKYKKYFFVSGDSICLDTSINFDWDYKLEYIKLTVNNQLKYKIGRQFENMNFLRSLGIHSIEQYLKSCMDVESELEQAYKYLIVLGNLDAKKRIDANLLKRTILLQNIISLSSELRAPFFKISINILEEKQIAGYCKSQGYYRAWENVEENLSNHKLISIIEEAINNEFISTNSYTEEKEYLIEDEECEEDEEYEDIKEDTVTNHTVDKKVESRYLNLDYGFYLIYLDKLNKYIEEYGSTEELLLIKSRLLYFLDSYKTLLYQEGNLEKELEKFKSLNNRFHEYKVYDNYVSAHSGLLFGNSNLVDGKLSNDAVKYALYFATQYELTQGQVIEQTISKYASYESYELISKIIFGKQKSSYIHK